LRIGKGLEVLNGHRDSRDKIMINLCKMLKKSMADRGRVMMQTVELKGETVERINGGAEGSICKQYELFSFSKRKIRRFRRF